MRGPGVQEGDQLNEEQKKKFNNDTKIDNLLMGDMSGLLGKIDTAEERGDWKNAFEYYQQVFDSAKDEIYQIPDWPHTSMGLRRYCLERLNGLPEEQKARYRAIVEGDAKPLLKRAIEERSDEILREVVRRYMLTSAGLEALRILGWEAYEAGAYGDAVYYWGNILKYHPKASDETILAGMAKAYAAAGEARGLNEIAALAGEKFPKAKVMVEGKETLLTEYIGTRIAALGQGITRQETWKTPGGVESQVRRANSIPTVARKIASVEFRSPVVDAVRYAAIDDNVLYVNAGDEVLAISVFDGRVLWRCAPRKTALEMNGNQNGRAVDEKLLRPLMLVEHGKPTGVTVGKHLIYTTGYGRLIAIRRDNGRLQWYSEIADQDMQKGQFPGLVYSAVSPLLKHNRIYSVEVKREMSMQVFIVYCRDAMKGTIIWRRELGSEDVTLPGGGLIGPGVNNDDLRIFSMPSIMCESEGVLYVSTSGGAVGAIDELSGDLLWLTLYHRGSNANQAPFMVDGWEYCPPVVAGGKFVAVPQDSEYLYVFDAKSGKPLWFRPRKSEQGRFLYIAGVDPQRGLVFVAGDTVAAYDLNEGRTKAESSPLTGVAIGPGVICKNKLYIPTTAGVCVVDMDKSVASGVVDAQLLAGWEAVLDANEVKNDPYAIVKTAGNLAILDGVLVSTNGARATVMYDINGRLGQLDAKIGNGEGDPDGNFTHQRAQMRWAAEKKDEAMSDLEIAIAKLRKRAVDIEGFEETVYVHYSGSAPASGEVGFVSYKGAPPATLSEYSNLLIRARQGLNQMSFEEAMRELGQNPGAVDFKQLFVHPANDARVKKLLHAARDSAIDAKTYVDSQLVLIEYAKRGGNWQEYVDLLMQMMREWGEASYDFSRYDAQMVTRDVSLFCTTMIGDVLRTKGANFYTKYDAEAEVKLKAARGKGDPDALLKVASEYPNSIHAGRALVDAMGLAMTALDAGRQAYLAREYLWRFPNGADRFTAMATYAEGLGKLGKASEARVALREMATRAVAEGVPEFNLRGNQLKVAEYVEQQVTALQGRTAPDAVEIPFANCRVRRPAEMTSNDYIDAALLDPAGIAPPGMENAIFMLYLPSTSDYAELKCMDRSTLEELWSVEVRGIPRADWKGGAPDGTIVGQSPVRPIAVAYSGNSVVLNYGTSISAFDPYNGSLRWLKEMPLGAGGFPSTCITDDMVFVSSETDMTVSAVNSRTGHIVWRQNLAKVATGQMVATADRLLVMGYDAKMIRPDQVDLIFLDRRNGQIKGTVPALNTLGLGYLSAQGQLHLTSPFSLILRPLDDKRVLVLSRTKVGLYGLEKGDVIWENDKVGAFDGAEFNGMVAGAAGGFGGMGAREYYGVPSPMGVFDVGEGICAVSSDNMKGVRVFSLEDGKLVREFVRPEGWYMWDWFLDKGRLTMFVVQATQDVSQGLDFVQYTYAAASGAELYKNEFPTGKFMFRPVVGKDHVIFVKEDLQGEAAGQGTVIVYGKADGKVVSAPFQISGLGHSPSSSMIGKGREFVVKGRKKVVVLRLDEGKPVAP